jgi:hypothetical protein
MRHIPASAAPSHNPYTRPSTPLSCPFLDFPITSPYILPYSPWTYSPSSLSFTRYLCDWKKSELFRSIHWYPRNLYSLHCFSYHSLSCTKQWLAAPQGELAPAVTEYHPLFVLSGSTTPWLCLLLVLPVPRRRRDVIKRLVAAVPSADPWPEEITCASWQIDTSKALSVWEQTADMGKIPDSLQSLCGEAHPVSPKGRPPVL